MESKQRMEAMRLGELWQYFASKGVDANRIAENGGGLIPPVR